MVKIINYSFLKYFQSFDLLYKYRVNSIFVVPVIKKINLKIFSIQNSSGKIQFHYKAFLFFYLANFCFSKICLKFFIKSQKRLKTISLKSNISLNISPKYFFDFLILFSFFLPTKLNNFKFGQFISSRNTFFSGKPSNEKNYLSFSSAGSSFLSTFTKKKLQQLNFNNLTLSFQFLIPKPSQFCTFNFDMRHKTLLNFRIFKNNFMLWTIKI
jgi:hypothetical protein